MNPTANKISDRPGLRKKVEGWKNNGETIVFTNGCFDILHLGHIDYLEKAAALGDRLVIGVNTDDSVKRLKGADRPLNNEYSRGRLLAALEFVDALTYFDEDTPYKLIKELNPDILVKGSDYLAENVVGADIVVGNGGKVETIDLVQGYSTTSLVEKIKSLK